MRRVQIIRRGGAVAGAVLLCVLGACASGGAPLYDRPGLHLSSWSPHTGQLCGLLDDLPAFGAVFDSAVVVSAIKALGESAGEGVAVLDVRIVDPDADTDANPDVDPAGDANARLDSAVEPEGEAETEGLGPMQGDEREVRVRVAESTLSADEARRLEQILLRGVLPDAVGNALLRIDFNPHGFQWANTLFCRPMVVNEAEFVEALVQVLAQTPRSVHREEVILDMFVGTDGSILAIEIHEGSGDAEVDRAAVIAARTLRFAPASHNRVPTPVFVRIPVRTHTALP